MLKVGIYPKRSFLSIFFIDMMQVVALVSILPFTHLRPEVHEGADPALDESSLGAATYAWRQLQDAAPSAALMLHKHEGKVEGSAVLTKR